MKSFSFFKKHNHVWKTISAGDYDNSTSGALTIILKQCTECNDFETSKIAGHHATVINQQIEDEKCTTVKSSKILE